MTGSAGRSVEQKTAAAKRGWRTRRLQKRSTAPLHEAGVSRETEIGRSDAPAQPFETGRGQSTAQSFEIGRGQATASEAHGGDPLTGVSSLNQTGPSPYGGGPSLEGGE